MPWLEVAVVGALLAISLAGMFGGYRVGIRVGDERAMRRLAELAGKEREALQHRIDETPRPASPDEALKRL